MTEFRKQRRNANKHTPRGLTMLKESIRDHGWIDAQTATADGEIISGSARLEVSDKSVEPIVVDSDGSRPVIVRRTDIPNADDPRATRLAIAANRVAQIDLDWDLDLLKGVVEFDADFMGKMFAPGELTGAASDILVLDSEGGLSGGNYGDIRSKTTVPVNILGVGGLVSRDIMEAVRVKLLESGAIEGEDNGLMIAEIFQAYVGDMDGSDEDMD